MSYTLERFGSATLPIYDPDTDVGTGASRISIMDLPDGFFDTLGNEQAPRQQLSFTKRGLLIESSPTALQTAYNALRAMRGRRDYLYRRQPDGTVESCLARLNEIAATKTHGDVCRLPVEISFVLISRNWSGARHGGGWDLDSGEDLDTGLVFDEAYGGLVVVDNPSVVTQLNNGGNADVKNTVMVFDPGTAPVSQLIIRRYVDAAVVEELQFDIYIYVGNTLTIDCGGFSVTVNGPAWEDTHLYQANDSVVGVGVDGVERYYYCSTPGTSGGAEPTWPSSGTVADGTAVWTFLGTTDQYDGFSRGADHQSDGWLTLKPGDNEIEIARTGGSVGAEITFSFSDGWE